MHTLRIGRLTRNICLETFRKTALETLKKTTRLVHLTLHCSSQVSKLTITTYEYVLFTWNMCFLELLMQQLIHLGSIVSALSQATSKSALALYPTMTSR